MFDLDGMTKAAKELATELYRVNATLQQVRSELQTHMQEIKALVQELRQQQR